MPKGNNQKLKLFYLMQIMLEKTDEEHGITMPEIIRVFIFRLLRICDFCD